jgi:putative protease
MEEVGEMEKTEVGKISHFYGKINVAVVDLTNTLKVGDQILIEGPVTSVKQTVDSMQIEHENVEEAKKGQSIGLKVADKVKENDTVYKITE